MFLPWSSKVDGNGVDMADRLYLEMAETDVGFIPIFGRKYRVLGNKWAGYRRAGLIRVVAAPGIETQRLRSGSRFEKQLNKEQVSKIPVANYKALNCRRR